MMFDELRRTSDNKLAGTIRLVLGILFLMTGAIKLLIPTLGDAFAGQLRAAELPFYELTRWFVPFLEILLGSALLLGAFARLAMLVVMLIMVGATYVHVVVDDPSLFPLQPTAPIIPLVVILLGTYVVLRGAGAWSFDSRASRASSGESGARRKRAYDG